MKTKLLFLLFLSGLLHVCVLSFANVSVAKQKIKLNDTNASQHRSIHVPPAFIELKLEYKGSSWHEAGEQRSTSIQLAGSAFIPAFNKGVAINPSNSIATNNNVYRNTDFSLATMIFPDGRVPQVEWNVNLTGTITHYMVGYPETKWVDQW